MAPPMHISTSNTSLPCFSWNGDLPKVNYLGQPVRRKDPNFSYLGGAHISWKDDSLDNLIEDVNCNELFGDFSFNPEQDKQEAEQDLQSLCNKKMKVRVAVRNIKKWNKVKKITGMKKNEIKDTNISSLSQG